MIVSGDKTGLLRNFRSVLVMRCPLHIKLTLLLASHRRLGADSLLGNLLFRNKNLRQTIGRLIFGFLAEQRCSNVSGR